MLIIRVMQIKMIMKNHFKLVGLTYIKKTWKQPVFSGFGKKRTFTYFQMRMPYSMENSRHTHTKRNYTHTHIHTKELLHNLEISFLGIYPRNTKAYILNNICAHLFSFAVLRTIIRLLKPQSQGY